MSSDRELVDSIVERMSGGGEVRARSMFGEFGIYCDDRMIGQVNENTLFIKVTATGAGIVRNSHTASPYPGAKPAFVIDDEADLDDDGYLSQLARVTADALPAPKKRR
ncbi:MAG: TfoX/Sxy family protein [Actinomycetota bacterium]|nr:TfoX/Sxy family protein [Actinomycetota bacterium]